MSSLSVLEKLSTTPLILTRRVVRPRLRVRLSLSISIVAILLPRVNSTLDLILTLASLALISPLSRLRTLVLISKG